MFVFTRQERIVFYFLLTSLVVGGVLNTYRRHTLETKLQDPSAQMFLQQFQEASRASGSGQSDSTAVEVPVAEEGQDLYRFDLNRATEEDLEKLPRVGPVMARRIVAYRQRIGGFRNIDQLQEVRGIGERTLERLRPHLYVGGSRQR